MFSSAPAMSVSPPDSCIGSWCACDGVRRWPRGDTSSWDSRPRGWGHRCYRGPRSPSPFLPMRSTWPWPRPWPQPLLASSLQNGLLLTSLHDCGLLLQQPKGTKALTHSASVKKGLCVCGVYVSVRVVQNKATDSHVLQGWTLVADQTSRVSSLRALLQTTCRCHEGDTPSTIQQFKVFVARWETW